MARLTRRGALRGAVLLGGAPALLNPRPAAAWCRRPGLPHDRRPDPRSAAAARR